MSKRNLNIDFVDELPRFLSFLDLEDNEDIVFSAPFGTGKTHFLKEIFQNHEQVSNMYNIVHLFPVNYSVASNEDIFDLVKYDVLFELKEKHNGVIEDRSALEFSKLLVLQGYLQSQFKPITFFKDLIHKSGIVGKAPFKMFDLFKKEYEAFDTYDKELNSGEDEKIIALLKEMSGTLKIKETDPISSLICKINARVKEGQKQNILIIDDLDRIDPEHIFRIINIFSAHRDYDTKEHKLGFDKVMLVCDIENIRKIYAHKYGADVDFTGYISKFLSSELYDFNIKRQLTDILDNTFQNIQYIDKSEGIFDYSTGYAKYNFSNRKILGTNSVYQIFKFYINYLIDNGVLNIRAISKIKTLSIRNKHFSGRGDMSEFESIDFPFLIVVDYLDVILGGSKQFYSTIKGLKEQDKPLSYTRRPTLFVNPEVVIVYLLQELLLLKILPNKQMVKEYHLDLNGLKLQRGVIDDGGEGNSLIRVPYKALHAEDRNGYRIAIDRNDIDWARMITYDLNDFMLFVLDDFYQNNPSYQ